MNPSSFARRTSNVPRGFVPLSNPDGLYKVMKFPLRTRFHLGDRIGLIGLKAKARGTARNGGEPEADGQVILDVGDLKTGRRARRKSEDVRGRTGNRLDDRARIRQSRVDCFVRRLIVIRERIVAAIKTLSDSAVEEDRPEFARISCCAEIRPWALGRGSLSVQVPSKWTGVHPNGSGLPGSTGSLEPSLTR